MSLRQKFMVIASLTSAVYVSGASGQVEQIGSTSYDEVTVQAEIQQAVRIMIADNLLDLGSYTVGGGDLQGDLSFCVYSNTSGNAYNISAQSSNGAAASDPFTLTTVGDSVTYTVDFDDAAAFSAAAATLANRGSAVGPYTGGTDSNCGTDNASIRVTVAETGNLESALPGTYTDTLRLTVAPM
jgi:hypothetical protein